MRRPHTQWCGISSIFQSSTCQQTLAGCYLPQKGKRDLEKGKAEASLPVFVAAKCRISLNKGDISVWASLTFFILRCIHTHPGKTPDSQDAICRTSPIPSQVTLKALSTEKWGRSKIQKWYKSMFSQRLFQFINNIVYMKRAWEPLNFQ
jgi:hypothetical protein